MWWDSFFFSFFFFFFFTHRNRKLRTCTTPWDKIELSCCPTWVITRKLWTWEDTEFYLDEFCTRCTDVKIISISSRSNKSNEVILFYIPSFYIKFQSKSYCGLRNEKYGQICCFISGSSFSRTAYGNHKNQIMSCSSVIRQIINIINFFKHRRNVKIKHSTLVSNKIWYKVRPFSFISNCVWDQEPPSFAYNGSETRTTEHEQHIPVYFPKPSASSEQ
jgi:hypothetical protein